MRLIALRFAWLGIAAAAASCAPVERNTAEVARVKLDMVGLRPVVAAELVRVDPEEASERAFVGGMVGGMLGAGVAATTFANPALGAIIGGPAGAAIGAAVGIATTRPLPSYAPIAVPAAPVIPEFYDTWPPRYSTPPVGAQVAPPPPDWSAPLAEKTVPDEDPSP